MHVYCEQNDLSRQVVPVGWGISRTIQPVCATLGPTEPVGAFAQPLLRDSRLHPRDAFADVCIANSPKKDDMWTVVFCCDHLYISHTFVGMAGRTFELCVFCRVCKWAFGGTFHGWDGDQVRLGGAAWIHLEFGRHSLDWRGVAHGAHAVPIGSAFSTP